MVLVRRPVSSHAVFIGHPPCNVPGVSYYLRFLSALLPLPPHHLFLLSFSEHCLPQTHVLCDYQSFATFLLRKDPYQSKRDQ